MINVAVIGCGGNMQHAHVPRIKQARGVRLAAACDPVVRRAEELVSQYGGGRAAIHTDFKRMIETEKLDAVVISTPHYQHYAQALCALQRGLHVLVEKPLTIKAKHARALLDTARKKRLVLHVAYQRHHMPVYRHMRDLVAKGRIGTLQSVVGYVSQGWGRRPEAKVWRYDPELSGGGMLMDTGSHLVAAALFTSGQRISEVAAFTNNQGMRVDILATVSARFETGAVCSITTIGRASAHDERLALHGTHGCVVVDQHQWRITRALLDNELFEPPRSLKPETPDDAFFGWIQGRKGYEPPRYAVEVAKISEAAYRSAKARRATRVGR